MAGDVKKWAKVQLLDDSGVVAEVLVPEDEFGNIAPEVVVYQGRYFTGPNEGYGTALPTFSAAPWYAVPASE